MQAPTRAAAGGLFTFLLTLVALAGCASDPKPEAGGRQSRHEPVPTLAGSRKFFDDTIVAEVRIGAMRLARDDQRAAPEKGDAPRPRRRGGPGMGPPEGGGDRGDGPRARGMQRTGPAGPPVEIRLKFTNLGGEPIELVIADFLSPLGNFVVRPEKLTLAPGATVETEPMASGLARQLNDGEVTLKLRLGARQESGTVPLDIEKPANPETGNSGQAL